ncbi:MAG: gliding motility-associated C-terminal domain-containing protein [Saprospiraceae bacterium]|jgi:gliding motility-associated-like protein|nr:gliding motility-associated C-terminal domain-containing protein [Saprospiraceae bacterium]
MKNLVFLILIAFSFVGNSQVKVNFGSINGNVGDTVSVTVNIDNFTKISSFQYSVTYDSLVLQYVGWGDRHPTISNVSVQDFDMWRNTRLINGQLAVSWNNDAGKSNTIPANESVFSLKFKLIGKQCDSSFVKLDNKPTPIEFIDENDNPLSFNSVGGIGKVKINGPGCAGGTGGGPSTDVTLIASIESGPQNGITYISISVKNFKNMESGQGTLTWDPAIGEYAGSDSTFVSRFDFAFNGLTNKNGVSYIFNNNNTTGVTLPDNYVIFKIGIKGVGPINSSTAITFGNTPVVLELSDHDSNIIPGKYESGKFTIVGSVQETLKLYYRDTFANEGGELCVPILVDGFTCMESFQFALRFDTTLLKFKAINDPKITPFGNSNVNVVGNNLNIIWDNSTAPRQTLATGTHMFLVCFDVIGKCTVNTKLSFLPLQSALEFSNCNGMLAINKVEGNIEIRCGVAPTTCVIDSAVGITCNGVCDGRAGVTLGGGSGVGFTYEWIRINPAPTGVVSTVQDPTGLCPGEYRLRFRDVGNANAQSQCPLVTIKDVEPITCTASVMDVSGVGKSDGKIELTVSGGTPGYKYEWFRVTNPNLKIGVTNILANLAVGSYFVIVTDSKGCTKRDTFKISPFIDTINITGIRMVDSIKCFGECTGALQVDISGGIIPFNYNWSGPSGTVTTNPARNLCAGLWKVTVIDGKGETDTMSFVLNQPTTIVIQQNGKKPEVIVTGGTSPYTIAWKNAQNQIVGTGTNPTLVDGAYTVCVTDRNNCTQNIEILVMNGSTGNQDTVKVTLAIDPKSNGSAISCKGSCDGRIIASASGGTAPYIYKWSHNNNLNSSIATDLCPGKTYTVTVTDNKGNTAISSGLTISDITGLSVSVRRVSCASDNATSDGSYEAVVSGGTKPYTYKWCNAETGNIATALASGSCSITVTDNNGCTSVEQFTVCIQGTNNANCYSGRLAISPNDDGYNDYLEIACVGDVDNVLYIYNRWGKQVYTAVNYLNTWNAKDQEGNELNEGTYMWVLLVKEPGKNDVYHKGTVTVVR